jgi:hypothetical protein
MLVPAQEGEEPPDKKHPGKDHERGGNGRDHDPGGPTQTQQPPPTQTQQPPDQTQPSQLEQHKPDTDTTQPQQLQQQGQPETVTIQDGGREISVTSPDGQGHVKVTVDDGSGKPKTYDLDFGAPTSPTGAGTHDPAHPGTQDPTHPGTLDGRNIPPGPGQPGTNMPVIDPATGQPVDSAGTPVHAGADGKCVIHDGQTTITAEHPPGQPDTVKVTIDDGSGKPTSYTLDYSEPGNPKADKGFGGEPVRAMPVDAPVADDRTGGSMAGHGPVHQRDLAAPIAAPAMLADTEPAAVAHDPGQQTAAQSSASAGSDYSASGSGSVANPPGGPAGSFGAPDTGLGSGQHTTAGSGEAGLAAAADSGDPGHQQGQLGAVGSGGMPMMGGIGAGGGDQDRSASQWRTAGDLFDEDYPEPAGWAAGVVADDNRGSRR